ncbi:MAG: GDP-mannose 4,6-dehydratase [Candidatus Thorarchaeota archaeon]
MEKILITGANGFIGSHLIDFCLKEGFQVYGLDRKNQTYRNLSHYTDKLAFSKEDKQVFLDKFIKIPTNNKNLILLECDIKNAFLLEKIIVAIKPAYIFHFAAQPYIIPSWENPVDTIETNVVGTVNVFESIKKNRLKTKVILACTSTEYGTSAETNKPLTEDTRLLPVHPYGISKVAAELLARQYYLNFDIECVNLRFFNQTGIRRVNDAPSDFIRKLVQIELDLVEPIIEVGNLNSYRDFTDIRDSTKAIWLAANKGKPGETYNICSNRKIQIRSILNIILSYSKKKIEIVENIDRKLRKRDEDIIIGDFSKIKEDLGWQPTISIEDTLEEMYNFWTDYYRKEGKGYG